METVTRSRSSVTRSCATARRSSRLRSCRCWAPRRRSWIRCPDRKSTRLNSSHLVISYAVFCLKKKKNQLEGKEPVDMGRHWQATGSLSLPLGAGELRRLLQLMLTAMHHDVGQYLTAVGFVH